MTETPRPARTRRLIGYWWMPLTIIAVVLAVMAFLHPYQPLEPGDLPAEVQDGITALDRSFASATPPAIRYATRRSYTSAQGPVDVEIRSRLQSIGQGLVMRDDDWFDLGGRRVIYQERYILWRNLFSLQVRNREVAPLVHDLMGRIGWFNDTALNFSATLKGGTTPQSDDWTLDGTSERVSDTDGQSLTLQTTHYQRVTHCERAGVVNASEMGAAFSNGPAIYPRVRCRNTTSNQSAQRTSDYAWIQEHGIFLLLGYEQQAGGDKLAAKGQYISFEVLPNPAH
ncbi:MAG: hypothetical protein EOO28_28875 [Comamonadaceae bacterium]|nr:MAG: hypothetical protein EOO28_28875 [Comamonadaceae bacterium]